MVISETAGSVAETAGSVAETAAAVFGVPAVSYVDTKMYFNGQNINLNT